MILCPPTEQSRAKYSTWNGKHMICHGLFEVCVLHQNMAFRREKTHQVLGVLSLSLHNSFQAFLYWLLRFWNKDSMHYVCPCLLMCKYGQNMREGVKKSGYFTVRLTVSVYPTLPPYSQLFVNFFWVCFFILDYDSMCSETDFPQEKVNFHATTGIPGLEIDYRSYLGRRTKNLNSRSLGNQTF